MCINSLAIIFDIPPLEDDPAAAAATEIYLRGFRCSTSPGSDVWLGELYDNKDGRYLLNSHPMSDAECTFPTGFWIYDGFLTQSMRCSGFKGSADGDSICGITDMKPGVLAGHSCQGGLFDQKDSNDGTTREA